MDTTRLENFASFALGFGQRKKRKKTDTKYAGFNRRMMAVTIDSIILLFFLPLINRLTPVDTTELHLQEFLDQPSPSGRPLTDADLMHYILSHHAYVESLVANFLMQMLFWCVYSAIFLHFWSATPGKMLLRMKVVDGKTGGRINDLQVVLRSFGYLVSTVFFCLGFIWINLNKRRRGWHDILADTVVINLPMPWHKQEKAPDFSAVPDTTEHPIPPETITPTESHETFTH